MAETEMDIQEALFAAVRAHDYFAAEDALKAGANPCLLSPEGETVIHALDSGTELKNFPAHILQLLLQYHADVNLPNSAGQTPLDYYMSSSPMIVDDEVAFYKPDGYAVLNLFLCGAKMTDHEANIRQIREAMYRASGSLIFDLPTADEYETQEEFNELMRKPRKMPIEAMMEIFREHGCRLPTPDLDAPATGDPRKDPCMDSIMVFQTISAIAVGFQADSRSIYTQLMANIPESTWKEAREQLPDVSFTTIYQYVAHFYAQMQTMLIGSAFLRHANEATLQALTQLDATQSWRLINRLEGNEYPQYGALSALICEGKRPDQIFELAQNYHNHVTHLNAALHKRVHELEWKPFLAEWEQPPGWDALPSTTASIVVSDDHKTITFPTYGGIYGEIVNLTTGTELVELGMDQNHCVSGYAGYCMGGHSHVFAIRGRDRETLSTFELSPYDDGRSQRIPNYRGQPLYLRQHYGPNNSEPPPRAQRLLRDFLQGIADWRLWPGDLEKMGDAGKNPEWANASELEKSLYHFAGDMTKERHQEIFDILIGKADDVPRLRAGRRTYLVPGQYRNMDVDTFMEESGLYDVMRTQCRELWGIDFNPPTKPAPTQEHDEQPQGKGNHWQKAVEVEAPQQNNRRAQR